MNRYTFFVILLLVFCQMAFGNLNSVNVLIQNRDVLINKFLSCSPSKNRIKNCYFFMRDSIIHLLESKDINDKQRDEIARIYFCQSSRIIRALSAGFWISDSINYNFLIKGLQSDSSYIAINAYNLLFENTSINHLRKNRDKIKKSLSHSSLISLERRIWLLALASDSVIIEENKNDTSSIEKEVRKFLSDTVSENKMIAALDTNPDFREKSYVVKKLLQRGNKRCLQALIVHFNEPSFDWDKINADAPPCTTQTLRFPIVLGVSRYFPENPFLNDSLYLLRIDSQKRQDKEYVARYFKEFLIWAKKEFGVEPKDPELPPTIEQNCRMP